MSNTGNVAIIPARGGSKRIPRKNILPFLGVPMVVRAIETAIRAGIFDRVIVSTDDAEIAQVARAAGAEAPFLRPADLSGDHVGVMPVVAHALSAAAPNAAAACLIYATSPFLRAEDLIRGRDALQGRAFAVSVASFPAPIQRAFLIRDNGLEMVSPEEFPTRSQDLPEAYHDAAQFAWGQAQAWSDGTALFGPDTAPVILPRHRVQDIDTPEDWTRAEFLYRALSASGEA